MLLLCGRAGRALNSQKTAVPGSLDYAELLASIKSDVTPVEIPGTASRGRRSHSHASLHIFYE